MRPLHVGVGLRDAGIFVNAGHPHHVFEFGFALLQAAGHRRGGAWIGRGRQRNMTFAGKQPAGRIEPHPACAGQVHFGPGVQIREVLLRAGRSFQRLDVRLELDQIARHEPRRQSAMPQDGHQQPGRVAARAGTQLERLVGRLHARLHANQVIDFLAEAVVDPHQEIDRAFLAAVNRCEPLPQSRSRLGQRQKRRQLAAQPRLVAKGIRLGVRLQEEVERVDRRHFNDQVDRHPKAVDLLLKRDAGQEVGVGVLLPIEKVIGRLDLQRVTDNRRSRMRRGPQPHDLRPQHDGALVAIVRVVIECDPDRHRDNL